MAKETNKRGTRVPLSEDARMDRLGEILRSQRPERRETLMDLLNREAAEEEPETVNGGDTDGREDA
ncbi:MAG: hypothetical protein ACLQPD_33035 [Desulfomonilaceae bacterium]